MAGSKPERVRRHPYQGSGLGSDQPRRHPVAGRAGRHCDDHETYPIGVKCCSVWLQGGELAELKTMYPMIEKYARAQGCDWLIGWGRDGWVKAMPGWQSCGTRRRKILT